MADPALLRRLVDGIQSMAEIRGCRIGYHGIYGTGAPVSRSLFEGHTPTLNYGRVMIVIEELVVIDARENADTSRWALAGASPAGAPNPILIENRSKLGPELLGAGLACGLATVSAVGVVGSAAAEVPSGGSSTFLLVASWAGMITAGAQCVNSLARLGVIGFDPAGSQLHALDSHKLYSVTMFVVDGIGVASGIAGLPAGLKNLWAILVRRSSFATRGLSEAAFRQMNRNERAKVISELVAEATRTPEGLQAVIAAARQAGVGAASMQRTSLSVRNATRMASAIADETAKRLSRTLLSVLSIPAGIAASAGSPHLVGSASGSVNYIINCIDISN
jgi:hypothetical protein